MTERMLSMMSDERTLLSLQLPRCAGLTLFRCAFTPGLSYERQPTLSALAGFLCAAVLIAALPALTYAQARNSFISETTTQNKIVGGGQLTEQIPEQYRKRYNSWKAALLSVESGRKLWIRYARNPTFRLTIIVSKSLGGGAQIETGSYQWAEGRLVAATMIIGHQLDQGYPDEIDYPVLGALAFTAP